MPLVEQDPDKSTSRARRRQTTGGATSSGAAVGTVTQPSERGGCQTLRTAAPTFSTIRAAAQLPASSAVGFLRPAPPFCCAPCGGATAFRHSLALCAAVLRERRLLQLQGARRVTAASQEHSRQGPRHHRRDEGWEWSRDQLHDRPGRCRTGVGHHGEQPGLQRPFAAGQCGVPLGVQPRFDRLPVCGRRSARTSQIRATSTSRAIAMRCGWRMRTTSSW